MQCFGLINSVNSVTLRRWNPHKRLLQVNQHYSSTAHKMVRSVAFGQTPLPGMSALLTVPLIAQQDRAAMESDLAACGIMHQACAYRWLNEAQVEGTRS